MRPYCLQSPIAYPSTPHTSPRALRTSGVAAGAREEEGGVRAPRGMGPAGAPAAAPFDARRGSRMQRTATNRRTKTRSETAGSHTSCRSFILLLLQGRVPPSSAIVPITTSNDPETSFFVGPAAGCLAVLWCLSFCGEAVGGAFSSVGGLAARPLLSHPGSRNFQHPAFKHNF